MPDNHAPAAQDEQEVTEELKEYQINALNLLDIPFQFFRVVAAKVQAEGITLDLPEQGDQLIDAYLHGALDDPLVAAAGECSNRAAAAATEVHRLQLEELTGAAGEDGNLPSLRKMVERERLENLAMLAYRAVALKFIVTQRIDKILDAEDEPQAHALYFELCQDLTPDLVADHSLTTELAEELTQEKYWEIDSGDLLDAATEEGPLWAQAVADAKRRREDPGSVPVSLGSLISAFDNLRADMATRQPTWEVDPEIARALQESRMPAEAVFPKDKVTKMLMSAKVHPDPEPFIIESGKIGKKEKSTTLYAKVEISLEQLPNGVSIPREFSPSDDAVFRAVCSLVDAGTMIFTGDDIYRVMTGNKDAAATPAQLQAIYESWVRLTTTAMKLDTGNMGDAYNFKRWEHVGHVIEGTTDVFTYGNQYGSTQNRYYKVNAHPALMRYADLLSQVERYPVYLGNTPVNKTPEILAIQNALLDRIMAIPRMNNTIRYNDIFKVLGNKKLTTTQKTRMRGYIAKMLDYWVEAGLLSKWEEVKEGRSYVAVKVTVKACRKAITETTKP